MSLLSILDYQAGNIQSVQRAVVRAGGQSRVITTASEVLEAEKLILPGVGHFGNAMAYLRAHGLVEALHEKVIHQQTPVLGICLGMQLMCASSEEGCVDGLGWFDAQVTRMQVQDTLRYKIPHTGWNGISFPQANPLLRDLEQGSEFYFVHAFHVATAPENQILTTTTHEVSFVSGLQRGHIFGVQFHPEKSHAHGTQLLRNFVAL
jgi:imidazole glycerol-phosphate synthase subunit HisH